MNLLVRLLIPLLLLAAGWRVGQRFAAEEALRRVGSLAGLEQAIRRDPTGHRYHYLIGRALRDRTEYHDLARAQEHLERAAQLNPYSWRYQMELARLYELTGQIDDAETALEKAVALNPSSATYRWRLANLYLRNDSLVRALPVLGAAIETDRSLLEPALQLLLKAGGSFAQADAIWPTDRNSRLHLLRLACRKRDPTQREAPLEFLREQWSSIEQGPEPPTIQEGAFYLQHLLSRDAFAETRQSWIRLARLNGIEDPAFVARKNLVWNGDFELKRTQSPLDWRLSTSKAYTIQLAPGEGFQGSIGLQIDFKGLENLSFAGVQQQVVVEPGFEYEMGFRLRSEELTTDQGIYVAILEGSHRQELMTTEPVLGMTPWTDYGGTFFLEDGSTVWIQLRRKPSLRIDNLITGRLWMDDVRLEARKQ